MVHGAPMISLGAAMSRGDVPAGGERERRRQFVRLALRREKTYSTRIAATGSARAARRAGASVASRATSAIVAVTTRITTGSTA